MLLVLRRKKNIAFDFFYISGDGEREINTILEKRYNIQNESITDVIWIDDIDKVVDMYKQNGGPDISEQEIKNADFSMLFNENYVLYGSN